MLCWLGVPVSHQVLWLGCVYVGRVSRPLAGCGVEVGGGGLGFRVGLPFVGGGQRPVAGARKQGLRLKGRSVVVG